MQKVTVNGKVFRKVIDHVDLVKACDKMAERINKDFVNKDPLFLVMLNGAFMFAADLMKRISIPCTVSFVKYASYTGTQTTGEVKELIGLSENIEDRNIVIIEDLVDTGITMDAFIKQLKKKNPKDVRLAVIFDKTARREKNVKVDYCGIRLEDEFVVGYGLDYDGYGRNLADLYEADE